MDRGFRGEVTDFYHRYRRGYPEAVLDELAAGFALTGDDVVVDLGCATGQLTLPMAGRVRAVVGMDPEADMVARGRQAAAEAGLANVSWVVGADVDVPALGALLGAGSLGAVTIGQALHWMDVPRLFGALRPLFRPGGGVAVVSNGRPVWMQDRGWSRALRAVLEEWRGKPLTGTFGADDATRAGYRADLVAAGFTVHERFVEHAPTMDLDQVVGNVLSALPVGELPTSDRRAELTTRIDDALAPHAPFTEDVRVSLLLGRVP